jgi:hypothetical protein
VEKDFGRALSIGQREEFWSGIDKVHHRGVAGGFGLGGLGYPLIS